MQLKSFLFAAFCLFTVAACHDHDHDEDSNAPVVTINSPAENASVSGEVHVECTATDASLHEMEVKVTKDSDGSELFKQNPTVHDETEYDFHEHFTPSVAAETAVTLTVTVSDHSDNTTVKTLKFTVKP
jgi:hypothetical protein